MILSQEDDFRFPVNDKIIICDKKIKTKKRRGYCCRYAADTLASGRYWVFSCVFVVVHPRQMLPLGLFDDLSRLHPHHWVFCCVLLLYTHVRCWRWGYCDNISHVYPHHWAYCCILVFVYPHRSLAQELAGEFCS